MSPGGGAERALALASWQPVLTSDRPRRRELLNLQPTWPLRPVKVAVHRNHPFELVAQAWPPFLAFAGMQAETTFGPYDDSLQLTNVPDADVHIVSLDFRRYDSPNAEWVAERIAALRQATTAPILVTHSFSDGDSAEPFNAALEQRARSIPATYVCDVFSLRTHLGKGFWDDRAVAVKGTDWSDAAVIAVARAMGTQWLPAVLQPPKKVVAVDLDNTLYAGIIGEDGVDGIDGTEHQTLHRNLQELTIKGILLAAITRNEAADVDKLFEAHPQWTIGREHFATVVANWQDKASNIALAAERLNVSTDSFVFLDDNAGELAAVAEALPEVQCLHASSPHASVAALRYCPGLFRFTTSETDLLRNQDVAAAQQRAVAANSADPADYLRSLHATLTYQRRPDVTRMHELAVKTNQFNVSLSRTPEAVIAQGLETGTLVGVTFSLRDRLSDSGVIGMVLAQRPVDGGIEIEEICISCRALGRSLEHLMIDQALLVITEGYPVAEVRVKHSEGPRNQPALAWLTSVAGVPLPTEGVVAVPWNAVDAERRAGQLPVQVSIEGNT